MFTEKKAQFDQKLMKLLKVKEARHHIGYYGGKELTLLLRLGETSQDYRFVLDAVPVEDEVNDELKELFNLMNK